MNPLKFKLFFLLLLISFLTTDLISAISEKKLKRYNVKILTKMISENPSSKRYIRHCLSSIIKDENGTGIRLIDKFGLFLYDSTANGILLTKTKFFYKKGIYHFIIFMKDNKDNQEYILYIEYKLFNNNRYAKLKNINFSLVFKEKLQELKNYFKSR